MTFSHKMFCRRIQIYIAVLSFVAAIVFAAAAFITPPRGQIHESMLYLIAQFLLLTTSILGVSSIVSNRQWRDDYKQKI